MRYESTGFFAAVRYCLQDFRRLSHFVGELVRPYELWGDGEKDSSPPAGWPLACERKLGIK